MFHTLQECIHYIENQIPQKIDLSLTRIEKAAELLGNPQHRYKTIHITGTNGKGSTSSFTAQLLSSQGLKVGLFTSPHLITYNERIRIGNTLISDDAFITLVERVIEDVLPSIQLTVFECLTLVGYLYFADQHVDVAVIEVGLGGRYDATNIIQPAVTCITNVSVDHVHFLSDDVIKIATEKSGIFKEKSINLHTVDDVSLYPIFENQQKVTYIQPYIEYKAIDKGFIIDFKKDKFIYRGLFSMFGTHQIRNLEAALSIVFAYLNLENHSLNSELLYEQIQELSWKGRMEQLQHNLFFDGAHNIAGVESLIQTIQTHFVNRTINIVFSVMKDKDYTKMLQMLTACKEIQHIYFMPLNSERALSTLPQQFVSDSKISEINIDHITKIMRDEVLTICAGSLYGYEVICEIVKKEGDL